MKAALLVIVTTLALCPVSRSQTSKSDLARLYGKSAHGTFRVAPGVALRAYIGMGDRVCGLVISGAASEHEVMQIFDAAVPPQSRGVKGTDMFECVGGCQQLLEYERVRFVSGVFDGAQASNPSAIITFKRPECKHVLEDMSKMAMHLVQLPH